MKAWNRILEVNLTGSGKSYTFTDPLDVEISGHKYLSALKDEFTVKIRNLTLTQVLDITRNKVYNVEIYVGYKSSGKSRIFKGEVAYISNEINDAQTNTIIIVCASTLLSRYGQSMMNVSFQSNLNLWTIIRYLCRQNGITNKVLISDTVKAIQSLDTFNVSSSLATTLEKISETYESISVNSDESEGNILSVFDVSRAPLRTIALTEKNIIMTQGYPRVSPDGFTLSVLPTLNFMCGDCVKIDNSLLQIKTAANVSGITESTTAGYQLNPDGEYIVYEIEYVLCNRENAFEVGLFVKNREYYKSLTEA